MLELFEHYLAAAVFAAQTRFGQDRAEFGRVGLDEHLLPGQPRLHRFFDGDAIARDRGGRLVQCANVGLALDESRHDLRLGGAQQTRVCLQIDEQPQVFDVDPASRRWTFLTGPSGPCPESLSPALLRWNIGVASKYIVLPSPADERRGFRRWIHEPRNSFLPSMREILEAVLRLRR